ncbi:uncharacterized protein L969DRAFT_94368 [Mixia osmundae IAM 14324]|uniref:N-acetyltransferase domain-containing protein n=1 Tax=Mixia osmundae (strain CBS 9802 / IAM 14324 / JCM 22182 / KY 12970) TaxID=764103 RepID=G7E398_MIXOS|nr:uncharacterized protein L969DRAFT_94368 [Mixia osmundae IAM 14324]KEI39295.1 hypothetical protein L969DRAFT_94368 [Mixia osmundae IAM 14324]GAA97308.1 hypothetical protein E5Q_03986 [Mixia osmundae IAM 14324]
MHGQSTCELCMAGKQQITKSADLRTQLIPLPELSSQTARPARPAARERGQLMPHTARAGVMAFSMRAARTTDLQAIMELHVSPGRLRTDPQYADVSAGQSLCFDRPLRQAICLAMLCDARGICYIAESDSLLVGVLSARILDDCVYVSEVCVGAEHRQKGVATGLLSALARECPVRQIRLHVESSNPSALSLYGGHALSFTPDGR